MNIKILADGGDMKPGPALSQKLGPAGINVGQVIAKINEATKGFKGIKVPIELDVNTSTKEFHVKVFSPPTSELLKKELGIEKGSGLQKKKYAGNASIEQVISVASSKMQNLLSRDLKTAVKNVVGTCVSLGVLIENLPAKELAKLIDEGKFDKEIHSEKTQTSPEKLKKLKEYFDNVYKEQEKAIQQEKAAQEAAEAAKVAETAAKTPAAGEAKPGAKVEEKTAEKKAEVSNAE